MPLLFRGALRLRCPLLRGGGPSRNDPRTTPPPTVATVGRLRGRGAASRRRHCEEERFRGFSTKPRNPVHITTHSTMAAASSAAAAGSPAGECYFQLGPKTLRIPMTLFSDNRRRLCERLRAKGVPENAVVVLQGWLVVVCWGAPLPGGGGAGRAICCAGLTHTPLPPHSPAHLLPAGGISQLRDDTDHEPLFRQVCWHCLVRKWVGGNRGGGQQRRGVGWSKWAMAGRVMEPGGVGGTFERQQLHLH